MAEAIIKYSRLIEDDGGFDALRKELDLLGDDLKKKANELKGVFTFVDPNNNKDVEKLQSEIDELKSAYKELAETNKLLQKTQKQYQQTTKKDTELNSKATKSLVELEKKLNQYKLDLKELNTLQKLGKVSTEDAIKQRVQLKLKIKETSAEYNQEQKEIIASNKLTKKQKDLIQAQITLQEKRIDTMDEIHERMKALRIVIKATNISTQEGKDAVAEMNEEINELSQVISENSDKYIQNKINIGNYKESVIEALEETDIFKTNIAILDNTMGKLLGMLKKNTKAVNANTLATKKNTKAVGGMRKAWKLLGNVMKASVIFLIIGALLSLFAVFKQGRAGVIKTEKAMAVFNATVKVVINTLADFGTGLIQWISSLGSSFSNLSLWFEKLGAKMELFLQKSKFWSDNENDVAKLEKRIAQLDKQMEENSKNGQKKAKEGWEKMANAITGYKDRLNDAKSSISTSFKAIADSFKIADRIRRARLELLDLRKELTALEIASDDSTTGLRTQLEATRLALIKGQEVFAKEEEIAKMQLSLANAKARADLASAQTSIGASATRVLAIKDELLFAKELLRLNQNLAVEKNPLDDSLLEDQQQALQAYIEKTNEFEAYKLQSAKKEREIKRDLFEQDLDLLIDLIDRDKTLSEQYVNDISKNFKSRVAEMQNFFKKFAKTTQQELDLFTRTAKDQGLDLQFKIEYNDDGSFKVFMGDQELALDNVKKLNEQLQGAKLSEISINRFREFVLETKAAQKDFKDLNKMLAETDRRIKELSGESVINQDELDAIRKINAEYDKLNKGGDLSKKEKQVIIKKIEELEAKKKRIQDEAEEGRLRNRISAIDRELKAVEKGSERQIELSKERVEIETQLEEKKYDKMKEGLDKVINTKSKFEKFADELKEIFNQVLDAYVEVAQKQVDATEDRVDKQDEMVDRQRERAEAGLSNTFAFEQRELAKREAERVKAEKKLERAEMIKSLWTSYTSNSSNKDVKNPVLKTLKDFAILRAFTASFGDGGLVADKVPTDGRGITRGRSHQGRMGGIPVLVEGNEGFFSGREVSNLGKDNFYALKEMAGRGPIGKNVFKRQRQGFEQVVDEFNDRRIVQKLDDVKDAIKNKPEHSLDVAEMVQGMLHLVETTKTGNKTVRNHYKIKRPKI